MTESGIESWNSLWTERKCKPFYLKNSDLRSNLSNQFNTDYNSLEPIKQVIDDDLLGVELNEIFGLFIWKAQKKEIKDLWNRNKNNSY